MFSLDKWTYYCGISHVSNRRIGMPVWIAHVFVTQIITVEFPMLLSWTNKHLTLISHFPLGKPLFTLAKHLLFILATIQLYRKPYFSFLESLYLCYLIGAYIQLTQSIYLL